MLSNTTAGVGNAGPGPKRAIPDPQMTALASPLAKSPCQVPLPSPLAKSRAERIEDRDARNADLRFSSHSASEHLSKPLKLFGNPLRNGVTVAYRFLGQAIDFTKVVSQPTSVLIRLFPATSDPFAKLKKRSAAAAQHSIGRSRPRIAWC
jgi:hypothetical protein